MIRDLVPVLALAVVALGVYLVVRAINRTADLKRDLSKTLLERNEQRAFISRVEREVDTQLAATYTDVPLIKSMFIQYHDQEEAAK